MKPTSTPMPASATPARRSANRPMPSTQRGAELTHRLAQRVVAVHGDRSLLVARELVERQVAARGFEEQQRTVVGDEEALEERVRACRSGGAPSPTVAAR